ncbi:unnamed protein product [Clavelina lepadiformis]|uniref:CCHC-type domain-containing protein n=1 Tax=Clavelina lepadiformis TaxID=159417 RepID=A0ABP0G8V1_CLALP
MIAKRSNARRPKTWKDLDEILKEFEIQAPARLGVDKYGIKDRRRIYKVNKKTMERHQHPSYLYLGKLRCAVSYNGQISTCSYCTEQGHKFKECPNRIQPSTDNTTKQELPKTPTRAIDPDDERPATPPNESSTVDHAASETKELRRGTERESAKDAKKSRPTTENPQENSREPDSYEGSSEREHSESRGNKRKNISGESDEQQEEPGFMDEQIPHDASSIPPNLSRLIPCSCGQLIRIRRNKSSRKTTPNFHQPIYSFRDRLGHTGDLEFNQGRSCRLWVRRRGRPSVCGLSRGHTKETGATNLRALNHDDKSS